MRIAFKFNPEKATQVMAYILTAVDSPLDKVQLTKLLYLADRQSFIMRGVSITGDRLVAMPYGPVPSHCLKLLNGEGRIPPSRFFSFIHVDDNKVSVRGWPEPSQLSRDDCAILDQIVREHGSTNKWELVRQTHDLPEYRDTYVKGTSTLISFEAIAEASKDERRFRHNRAVISPETAAAMTCPFNAGEDESL